MDYEDICETLMRKCMTMADEKYIAYAYEALKNFSEDELVGECDLCVGESIRAKRIIALCGRYLKAAGRERADIREDIAQAVDDFYNY